jgi:hypothetical protein
MPDPLPEPLTPADCDLRGYEFMPLFGTRLFGSELYALALDKPRAGWAALKLWWEAWQQCPAGSLPSDDKTLCRLADLGTDLRSWRYYHPILAQEATSAFISRRKERDKKRAQRDAKANKNKAEGDFVPGDVPGPVPYPVPGDVPETSPSDRDRTVQEQASSTDSVPPRADIVVPFALRATDPPEDWLAVAPGREAVYDAGAGRFCQKPFAGGAYLDDAARLLCEAARLDPTLPRTDWRYLTTWLVDGADLALDILPTVRHRAERVGYEPPRTLAWYNDEMKQLASKRRALLALEKAEMERYAAMRAGGDA